jgi:tetratricopeptide (TPR) repeat protein
MAVLLVSWEPLLAQKGGSQSSRSSTVQYNFSVSGKVVDPDNHAQLEGARVELRTFTGANVGTVFTRAGGNFEFLNVGVGSYDLIVQQAGYHTVTQRLDVVEAILGISVELHPNSATASVTPGMPPVSARELSIPRKARESMDKGLALIDKKSDYRGSIKQFERAIRSYPEYYEAYTEIGIACMHTGNNPGAEEALRKAAELSREQDANVLAWFATLLNDSQRFADAEPIARKALELDSSSWQANAELARSLLGLIRPAEAEKSALAASKLQPENALLYLVLANVHSQLENPSAFLEDLTNYLRLAPTGPVADKAREQQKQLQDKLRDLQQSSVAPAPNPSSMIAADATTDGAAEMPVALPANFDDSPIVKSGEQELDPVLWPPTNVDASLPPVVSGVSCSLEKVLKGTRQRVQELLENVDRFTATEVVNYAEIGKDGRATRSLKYNFDYLAAFSLARDGDLRFEESRTQIGKGNPTPLPIRTVGLAVGAAVFHPLRFDDFEITCEGLGQWHAKPAWQLHFEQRPDRQPRFQAVLSDGKWYDVKLKGRAWISPESSQIEHIDFDLLEAIPPIRLQTEHMSLDYSGVDFPNRKLQLWLPQSVNFYIDIGGHRFLNRHQLSNYILFAVDTSQDIQLPRQSK